MTCNSTAPAQPPAAKAAPVPLGLPRYGGARAAALPTAPPLTGLRYVEVETARYCNRTCSWCPNGHTGARRVQQLMPWPLLAKVAAELGERPADHPEARTPPPRACDGREGGHDRPRRPRGGVRAAR